MLTLAMLGACPLFFSRVTFATNLLTQSDPPISTEPDIYIPKTKKEKIAFLIDLLNHEDLEIRSKAIEQIVDLDKNMAVKALLKMLHSDDEEVQIKAALALGRIKAKGAVKKLRVLAASTESDRVKGAAGWALLHIGTKTSLKAIGKLLSLPGFGPLVGKAIQEYEDELSIKQVSALLHSEDDFAVVAAASALGLISKEHCSYIGVDTTDKLIELSSSGKTSDVKLAASDALLEIAGTKVASGHLVTIERIIALLGHPDDDLKHTALAILQNLSMAKAPIYFCSAAFFGGGPCGFQDGIFSNLVVDAFKHSVLLQQSDNEELKETAIRISALLGTTLVRFGSKKGIPIFISAYFENNASALRSKTAELLRTESSSSVVKNIGKILASPEVKHQKFAAIAIINLKSVMAEMESKDVNKYLVEAIANTARELISVVSINQNEKTKHLILLAFKKVGVALARYGDAEIVEELILLLKHDDPVVVVKALDCLAGAAGIRNPKTAKQILFPIFKRLRLMIFHDDAGVRESASDVLITVGGRLIELGKVDVVDVLLFALEAKNKDAAEEAAKVIGVLGNKKSVNKLMELIEEKNKHAAIALRYLGSKLAKQGDRHVIDRLIPLLAHKDVYVRYLAGWCMSSIDGDSIVLGGTPKGISSNPYLKEGQIIFPKGTLPGKGATVEVTGFQTAGSTSNVTEINFVFDCSGSMDNLHDDKVTKFELLKSAVSELLKILPGEGLITYNLNTFGPENSAKKKLSADWNTKVSTEIMDGSKQEIENYLGGVSPVGNTLLWANLKHSIDSAQKKGVVILYSDGRSSTHEKKEEHNRVELEEDISNAIEKKDLQLHVICDNLETAEYLSEFAISDTSRIHLHKAYEEDVQSILDTIANKHILMPAEPSYKVVVKNAKGKKIKTLTFGKALAESIASNKVIKAESAGLTIGNGGSLQIGKVKLVDKEITLGSGEYTVIGPAEFYFAPSCPSGEPA